MLLFNFKISEHNIPIELINIPINISAGMTNSIIKSPVKIKYNPPKAKYKLTPNSNNIETNINFLLFDIFGYVLKSEMLKIA